MLGIISFWSGDQLGEHCQNGFRYIIFMFSEHNQLHFLNVSSCNIQFVASKPLDVILITHFDFLSLVIFESSFSNETSLKIVLFW